MQRSVNILPFIIIAIGLVLLLMMVALRPRSQRLPTSAAAATLPTEDELTILLNGEPLDTRQPVRSSAISATDPASWSLGQISRFDKRGERTRLVFVDGSVANVTSSTYSKLPGNIRVRINYDRSE